MRQNFVFSLLMSLVFAFSISAQQPADEKMQVFSMQMLEALKSGKTEAFIALKPDVATWRKIFPLQTRDLSDQQVYDMGVLNEKIKHDFNNIMSSAQSKNIDFDKLTLKKLELSESDPGILNGIAFDLYLSYGEAEYLIVYSTVIFEGRYYLSEILNSINIFK